MRPSLLSAALLLTAACTTAGGTTGAGTTSTEAPTNTTVATTTTTEPSRSCVPPRSPIGSIDATDPVAAAVELSARAFRCAGEVTLAPAGNLAAGRTAALHAARAGGPLLFLGASMEGGVAAEIRRLDPDVITTVGLDDGVLETLGGRRLESLAPRPIRSPLDVPLDGSGPLVVANGAAHDDALPAWVLASITGRPMVAVSADLRLAADGLRALVAGTEGPVDTVATGGGDSFQAWQVDVVRRAMDLPGGGQVLFPGRRLVAFYGNPTTSALGVLGEQGPAETVDRLLPIADEYAADGVPVVPAFEIIATVASSRAGADGDYSDEMPVDQIRPWVEVARERGVYVILDLQPGRTDFLTQAKRYEELLLEPHVGLALDPEWRLGPDQVHLRQIGSVGAAEVNTVVDWLAGLVREHALPQKMLLLHQFRFSMITERDQIRTPDELAVVIQMDGQGPLSTKYDSWNALTAATEESGWWWGWKNFYDEDSPMAIPSQVLALRPIPVYVSFQ